VAVSLLKPRTAVSEVKRPLGNRFGSETVTNKCVAAMSVAWIWFRPPGARHFTFYTYFYKPRLCLEKLFYNFLEAPTDFLNHFWIQVTASLLKPPNGGFRSET
jgi:hypothetical protein